MFLVCIPVLVPFWKNLGLTISEIFLLQGIFGAVLIIFDLPAGYVADLFGRKKTMLLGSVISALACNRAAMSLFYLILPSWPVKKMKSAIFFLKDYPFKLFQKALLHYWLRL